MNRNAIRLALPFAVIFSNAMVFSCIAEYEPPPPPDDLEERNKILAEVAAELELLETADASQALAALEHKDHRVRVRAMKRLDTLRNDSPDAATDAVSDAVSDAVPLLIDALNSDYRSVRIQAAAVLGNIGDEQAIEALMANMADQDRKVRLWTWKSIRKFGESAIPVMISHLKKTSPLKSLKFTDEVGKKHSISEELRTRMASLGTLALPHLIEALTDEDTRLNRNAASIIGRIGPKAKAAVPDLVLALENSEDTAFRVYTAKSLGKIADMDTSAVPALEKASKDSSKKVAKEAKQALKKIKKRDAKKRKKKKKKKSKKKNKTKTDKKIEKPEDPPKPR
ncbi:MAG: HEAT repeat domain-containing protein [Proteobacteria bacterium]|nr:HEAT repeat domain-containing protein [Pseudomonadota bacterium]